MPVIFPISSELCHGGSTVGTASVLKFVRSTPFRNDQPTRPNAPQHSNLHQHCCEKLKPSVYYIGLHSDGGWRVGSERDKRKQ
jgi:hypothetical protein